MSSASLTSTDRKHIIAMVSQKFLVRIKAIDQAIANTITAMDAGVEAIIKPLAINYDTLFKRTAKEVNTAITGAIKDILAKFHLKEIPTGYGGKVFGHVNIMRLGASSFDFIVPKPGVDIASVEAKAIKVWRQVQRAYDVEDTTHAIRVFLKVKDTDDKLSPAIAQALCNHRGYRDTGPGSEEALDEYLSEIRGWYASKVSARPAVKIKVSGLPTDIQAGYWPSLDLIEDTMYDLNLEVANIPKGHKAYKDAVKAYRAGHAAIETYVKERNALVQEHNDAVTRISMERNTGTILQILHDLGIMYNIDKPYEVLKGFTEQHYANLVQSTNGVLENSGVRMLTAGPQTDNDGVIDITAEPID